MEAVQILAEAEVVVVDVETTLNFCGLCLVQIATVDRTYLIDALALSDLSALQTVLSGPSPTKIIHNAHFERRILAEVGIAIDGVFDTLEASRRIRGRDALGGHSLASVCDRELGGSLAKQEQTSDWTRRPLDKAQVQYAALDAEILLRLWEILGPPQVKQVSD